MRRNAVMLDAFARAKVAKTAKPKFVGRLVTALERASRPRPKKPKEAK